MDECKHLPRDLGVVQEQRRPGDSSGLLAPQPRGLHSFPFQLNYSSSVHQLPSFTRERVLRLLKLSSNVNECKHLPQPPPFCSFQGLASCVSPSMSRGPCPSRHPSAWGLHLSTFQLKLSRF